jgi:hypothetical protein
MESLRHILASATLAIIVFGCFGNLMSMLVFMKVSCFCPLLPILIYKKICPELKRNSSINILLSALSLIDLCLLLFAIPVFVLPNLQSWYVFSLSSHKSLFQMPLQIRREHFYSEQLQAIIVKFLYPVNLIFQVFS